MRGLAAAALVCGLLAAGCSSSSKGSASGVTAAAGGTSGFGDPPSGVVASGSAKQTVPADLAFVVMGIGGDSGNGFSTSIGSGSSPPVPVPTENPSSSNPDHRAIRAALTRLGLAEDAIAFSATANGLDNGGSIVQVEVPVAKLPKIAHEVVDAVGTTGATVNGSGMRFAVSDCGATLTSARAKALENAHADAQALAAAGGVSLGRLVSVSESNASATSVLSSLYGSRNPCGRGQVPDPSAVTQSLVAIDAAPRVDLTESVTATYTLGDGGGRTISAAGEGETSGPADTADLIVSPGDSVVIGGFGNSANGIDENAVRTAVEKFGVGVKDIEVENPPTISVGGGFSQGSYVRVHLSIPQLAKSGHQIAAAIQSVVGQSVVGGPNGNGTASVGVLFHASNCRDLQRRARAAAVADARARIDKLAAAANVHAGNVTGLAEASAVPYIVPVLDPCDVEVDDLAGIGLFNGGSYPGLPQLADLDAAPVVTVQSSLAMSRRMGS